ncbi:MAG: TerC family protein [Saprospiraceae bacterium]|nr:TerC family protein [Saprospiraceae bacterium]MDZ4706487.1 TerC family protein [Saprospiraceae bacterium]
MLLWIIFIVLICFFLALDLGVFNKNPHVVSTREAFGWTALWVSVSLLFSIVVYYAYELDWVAGDLTGSKAVLLYLSGYLVEQSLSMDNIFVIAIIFSYFQVPKQYQHRVLFWGILGALVFRGIMIALGAALIHQFEWVIYIFGVFLLYSAYKMLTVGEAVHPSKNPTIKFIRRFFAVSKTYEQDKFFVRKRGLLVATPLFVALMVVETTDILFAFDSIPAIFGITTDPFLVFTSNIFAIMGLRSLYFVLASVLDKFQYLKYSLVAILFFVGVKMLLHEVWKPEEWMSLAVIFVALASGIAVSLIKAKDLPAVVEDTPVD